MKYELIQLNELILATLKLSIDDEKDLTANELNKIEIELKEACFLVSNALEILACSKQRNQILCRQVNKVQDYCCRILNKIAVKHDHCNKLTEILILVKTGILGLLTEVKATFLHCFDDTKEAPIYWQLDQMAKLKANENLLFAGLRKFKLEIGLKELLVLKFTQPIPFHRYSFEQLDYLVICQASLLNFCKKIANEQADKLLINHLIYLNFNELDFLVYVKRLIADDLAHLLHDKAQYKRLCEIEQDLVCVPQQRQLGFLKGNDTAQNQLLAYVSAGIVYFHRKADFGGPSENRIKEKIALENYRVKINLSVDALAYLLKLLIETGIIEAKPKSKVFQFFAQHFQTPGIGEELISGFSLSIKYQQVVQKTANNMRMMLRKMIHQIDANFD